MTTHNQTDAPPQADQRALAEQFAAVVGGHVRDGTWPGSVEVWRARSGFGPTSEVPVTVRKDGSVWLDMAVPADRVQAVLSALEDTDG